jgi:hypothetical protein
LLHPETLKEIPIRNNSTEKFSMIMIKITKDHRHQRDQEIVTKYNQNIIKMKRMTSWLHRCTNALTCSKKSVSNILALKINDFFVILIILFTFNPLYLKHSNEFLELVKEMF